MGFKQDFLIFQGVETASQIRYVTYYEKLLSMPCTYPDVISLKIESINISGNELGKYSEK